MLASTNFGGDRRGNDRQFWAILLLLLYIKQAVTEESKLSLAHRNFTFLSNQNPNWGLISSKKAVLFGFLSWENRIQTCFSVLFSKLLFQNISLFFFFGRIGMMCWFDLFFIFFCHFPQNNSIFHYNYVYVKIFFRFFSVAARAHRILTHNNVAVVYYHLSVTYKKNFCF